MQALQPTRLADRRRVANFYFLSELSTNKVELTSVLNSKISLRTTLSATTFLIILLFSSLIFDFSPIIRLMQLCERLIMTHHLVVNHNASRSTLIYLQFLFNYFVWSISLITTILSVSLFRMYANYFNFCINCTVIVIWVCL